MMKRFEKLALGVLVAGSAISAQAADNSPTIAFAGRIQADATYYNNDTYRFSDGSEVRRLRAGIQGNLTADWDYRIEYDFAPDEPEAKDVYLRYNGFSNARITFGNFKVFASLEELTSSNNTTFTERGLPNVFMTQRRMGVGYQSWSDRYSFAAAAYDNESNNLDRGKGIALRYAYRPLLAEGQLLHLGINAAVEETDDDTVRLRTRPEAHQDSYRILDTGTITGVDRLTRFGLEAAYVNGPFSAQAEYARKSVDRKSGFSGSPSFDGYYAYVSYFLTDDTRAYTNSDALFGTVSPSADSGAWEVAARFSSLNLDDGIIRGGDADAITFAVNYYMTRNLRFQANYVMTESSRRNVGDDPNALNLRVRFTW